MPAPILIVGQGLAGTLLAWEFERAGVDFEIADAGHAQAASRVGAGIINPITGQRLVKSWRLDEFLPVALSAYRELEEVLGVALIQQMRIRRFFRDERESRIFAEKLPRGDLAPYAGPSEPDGFWIENALRIDTAKLISVARERLEKSGKLRQEEIDLDEALKRHDLVILCTGRTSTGASLFDFAKLKEAKGEVLEVSVEGIDPGVILNRGHWLLPVGTNRAKVGATYDLEFLNAGPTSAARAELEKSARELLQRPFEVLAHETGLRVTTADRHPVVGRSPHEQRAGIFGGLGSKGALLAPALARQWLNHLTEGVPFDRAVDVRRFWAQ